MEMCAEILDLEYSYRRPDTSRRFVHFQQRTQERRVHTYVKLIEKKTIETKTGSKIPHYGCNLLP